MLLAELEIADLHFTRHTIKLRFRFVICFDAIFILASSTFIVCKQFSRILQIKLLDHLLNVRRGILCMCTQVSVGDDSCSHK